MVVPFPVSRIIGSFGLPRQTLLDLLVHVHQEIVSKYDSIKNARTADVRLFIHRFVLTDAAGTGHLFVFAIDDTTSPAHLMIVQIKHRLV